MKQATTVKRTTVKVAKSKNRIETPLEQPVKTNGDFNQKIQEKAYQLYVARGCKNGHDVEDWVEAERIIKGL